MHPTRKSRTARRLGCGCVDHGLLPTYHVAMSFLTATGDGRGMGKLISQIIYRAQDQKPSSPTVGEKVKARPNTKGIPATSSISNWLWSGKEVTRLVNPPGTNMVSDGNFVSSGACLWVTSCRSGGLLPDCS